MMIEGSVSLIECVNIILEEKSNFLVSHRLQCRYYFSL